MQGYPHARESDQRRVGGRAGPRQLWPRGRWHSWCDLSCERGGTCQLRRRCLTRVMVSTFAAGETTPPALFVAAFARTGRREVIFCEC